MATLDIGKAKKILSSTFVEDHENINEDDAAHLVVKAEQKIKLLTEEMNADEELAAAIQVKKDLESTYKSALQYERAKISFLLAKIDEIQSGEVNPHSSI